MRQEDFANMVYDLVCGNFDTERFPVPESYVVKDEFGPESLCGKAYENAIAAYSRLCVRLGVEDMNDRDVEIIFDSLMSISRFVGIKMFGYGQVFADMKMP